MSSTALGGHLTRKAPGPSVPARARPDSVDLHRGLVVVLMALDHGRDVWLSYL